MDILRTEGLTRQYGVGQAIVTALDHVDLQVERGQFVAIIGASGSGKSTLLHLLGGVDRPDGGKIFVEDVDIATFGEERLAQYRRRKVGLIYQFYNLIPTLSVKKNICLPMLLDNKEPTMNLPWMLRQCSRQCRRSGLILRFIRFLLSCRWRNIMPLSGISVMRWRFIITGTM